MSDALPLMPKATAVWLIDNTTLTFRQIAEFCGMHELEVSGIADGEVAVGIKGVDPVLNHQLTREEIKRCEADQVARLRLIRRNLAPPPKKKTPRYVPTSKRQDRPAAIAWLVRNHPELETKDIAKLVGSTKPTIEAIRNRTHWNSANIQPVDPVALGLCSQIELDQAVATAQAAKAAKSPPEPAASARDRLLSTEESLAAAIDPYLSKAEDSDGPGLEDPRGEVREEDGELDPHALFNLPRDGER
ncbi:MAG: DUF1013 domain-containing protein [Paracoccaceae bacterium]